MVEGTTVPVSTPRSGNVLLAHVIADIRDVRWKRIENSCSPAAEVEYPHAWEWPHVILHVADAPFVGAHQALHSVIDERMRKHRPDAGGDLCHVSRARSVVHPHDHAARLTTKMP